MTCASAMMFLLTPNLASAAPAAITFQYQHHLFTLTVNNFPDWKGQTEQWKMDGKEIVPPEQLLVDGDELPSAPEGLARTTAVAWNKAAIARDLERLVAAKIRREAGSVVIGKDANGKVTFDGVGLTGRDVDTDTLTEVTVDALDGDIPTVTIPVVETQPSITVTDAGLAAQGIREVVTVGESDFSNSPKARRHNIATGMAKFNGHLIPKDSIFSFVQVLGPVNGSTGYLKELVIKGDRVEPDFGGGLCQVSSTAYRGVWEAGFPITDRRNHSFAVNHYAPQGTDATVYPGSADMKFKNDGPSALLIQTYTQGDLAYFIYYGTKDARKSLVYGPFIWDRTGIPPDRIEVSPDLAPGEKKKVGDKVPGMKTAWYRITKSGTGSTKIEPVYSLYQARSLFYLVGPGSPGVTPTTPVTTPVQ